MTNENKKIYKPTLAEVYYWRAYADPYVGASRATVAMKAVEMMEADGVSKIPSAESIRQMTYQWENKEGYREWRDEFWKELMNESRIILDKIGLQRGTENFKYWEAMQMKYGNYKRKSDVTSDNKPINSTEQIANLLTNVLKDGGQSGDNTKAGDTETRPEEGEIS